MRRLQANSWEQKSRFGLQTGADLGAAAIAFGFDRGVDSRVDPRHLLPQGVAVAHRHFRQALLGRGLAVDVEDAYVGRLAAMRERDRAAGRTLEGPHRSDLVVHHGPKEMPASASSTGEQKALLVGLVLAHAELLAMRRDAGAPLVLLDEITAHLDERRRAALFEELLRLGSQAWMTGTDRHAFGALLNNAQYISVTENGIGGLIGAASH